MLRRIFVFSICYIFFTNLNFSTTLIMSVSCLRQLHFSVLPVCWTSGQHSSLTGLFHFHLMSFFLCFFYHSVVFLSWHLPVKLSSPTEFLIILLMSVSCISQLYFCLLRLLDLGATHSSLTAHFSPRPLASEPQYHGPLDRARQTDRKPKEPGRWSGQSISLDTPSCHPPHVSMPAERLSS